ncbi:serine/threonine-protein kinase [Sorangium sp. So ce1036]|uniref:serine/threonine-protein kinase n=1 Tax=Sorangium sp. So ce1036 TaxID=3133328 RepID=UPI003F032140
MESADLGAAGPYELLVQLATGGMAEVFIARRAGEAGERAPLVAVKRIRADLRHDPMYAEMLFDEAGLASRIASPHVVPVLDRGLDERGAPYLVMPLIVGVTLKRLARPPDPLEIGDAIDLVAQAADGLHAAHEARDGAGEPLQVIHRDISPSNILVGVDGRARLCDLGLAWALRRATRTKTGTVKGKLSYFSPEQAHARPLDRRSDVFSLGAVAWEVVAGRRLFAGSSMLSILHAVLEREVPPLSREREGVGPAVAGVVARALERDRDARWPTAADFAAALRDAAGREGHAGSRERVRARAEGRLPEPLRPLASISSISRPGGPLATPEILDELRAIHAAGVVGEGDSSGMVAPASRRG